MIETLLDNTNKLKLYLCCIGVSPSQFAKSIDYTPQMINGYLSGRRRLSRRAARMIEMGTKGMVSMEDVLKYNPKIPEVEKKIIEDNPMQDV